MQGLPEEPIPSAPAEVCVGIPVDLLLRRPDVRKAERAAAAQCARIGVAEAELYPSIGVGGFFGGASSDFATLFNTSSYTGIVAPNFSWKIFNYGRVLAGRRIEDARFQQKVLEFQQQVLHAGEEVEEALAGYLQSQNQAEALVKSVKASERFASLTLTQYKGGRTDFNRVYNAEDLLVKQQDRLATAQQDVALNLIRVYRALGGGWELFQHVDEGGHSNAPISGTYCVVPEK
jgi:outer membrane protein TolC